MCILKKAREFREDYFLEHKVYPNTIDVSYEGGLALLKDSSDKTVKSLVKRNNKEEITKFLNGSRLFGMNIKVNK